MLQSSENYIVCKDGEYLVGIPYRDTGFARMGNSAYDAYPFWDFIIAQRFAKLIGGKVMKFNRLNGKVEGGWQ